MCSTCTDIQTYTPKLTANQRINGYDPTRTTQLRNRFVKDLNKRFKELKRVIWKSVVTEDGFGLMDAKAPTVMMASGGRRAFSFPRSGDKVSSFMNWMHGQVESGILEVRTAQQIGSSVDAAWTNMYVQDSYKRGVIRARYEMGKAGYTVPHIDETGGVNASMATPFHMDRVGLLYTRTFSDLKGITDDMEKNISRILSQGMIDGDNPRLLARKMYAAIDGTGVGTLGIKDSLGRVIPARRRAEILARTEIIRAHHGAMIQEYRNWGMEGVRVKAELVSAQDDRVCEECMQLEGSGTVYTLDQAEALIPVHPQCRCIALPVVQGEKDISKQPQLTEEELYGDTGILDIRSLPKGVQTDIRSLEFDTTNAVLRFGAQRTDHTAKIDTAIKKYGVKLDQNIAGYRGVGGTVFPIQEGGLFTDVGFTRFSGGKDIAKMFLRQNTDQQLVRFNIPKGMQMMPGSHHWEKEVYFPRGTRFKTTKVNRISNGYTKIKGQRDWIETFTYEMEIDVMSP